MIEFKGRVNVKQVKISQPKDLISLIDTNIGKQASIYIHEVSVYDRLKRLRYKHDTILHKAHIYVKGKCQTNRIENFWSVLKGGMYGTYHQTIKSHLQAYLSEFSYMNNYRKNLKMKDFTYLYYTKGNNIKL